MKKILIALFVIIVAGMAGYSLWFSAPPAPSVSFTTMAGQKVDTSSLKGKVVLVNFWATSCPGCVEEMPQIRQMYQQYGKDGFTVIAVAMNYDNPDYIRAFAAKDQLPFMITHDAAGTIAKAFGDIQLTPTTFLIDRSGHIVKRYVGVMDFREIRQLIEKNTRT
jgi:peroxiredoxin